MNNKPVIICVVSSLVWMMPILLVLTRKEKVIKQKLEGFIVSVPLFLRGKVQVNEILPLM